MAADEEIVTGTQPRHAPDYIDTPDLSKRFLQSIAKVREIAVDTEGASFHRFVDRIYLIQISTRTKSAVLDPLGVGEPEQLGQLLEDTGVEVVFHDADYDLRLLHQDYGWHPRNLFDTRIAAQLTGIRSFGLAALLEKYFEVRLDKKHQRADWSMRPLSRDMLHYASQDTMYLLDLRDRLREELERLGRTAWAKEEFTRLEGTRWDAGGDPDAYQRIKGARDLNRRQLAVFREVARWRDEVARELDRATFRVAGNETLLEMARKTPGTPEDLSQVKGMPRGIVERRAAEILEAIRRGQELPESELPRFPRAARWSRDPDYEARVSRLRSVRDAAAQRLDIEPGVLCSRDRLETIARLNPSSLEELTEVEDLRRWQIGEMGEALLAALKD
jgi:ribonuclease D